MWGLDAIELISTIAPAQAIAQMQIEHLEPLDTEDNIFAAAANMIDQK